MLDDREAIHAHFTLHVGESAFAVLDDGPVLFPTPIYYSIPPSDRRPYWVLHTNGMSVYTLEGSSGGYAPRHAEFVMSLAANWDPSHDWPRYVLRSVARVVAAHYEVPLDGEVYVNTCDAERGSEEVFALVMAPSRQFGDAWLFRAPSGQKIGIYAMYPITTDQYLGRLGKTKSASALIYRRGRLSGTWFHPPKRQRSPKRS